MKRPDPPEKPCYVCKIGEDLTHTTFWRSKHSGWICLGCHPPGNQKHSIEQVDVAIVRQPAVRDTPSIITGKPAVRQAIAEVAKLFDVLGDYFDPAYWWIMEQPELWNEIRSAQNMMDAAASDGKSDNYTRECSIRYFLAWRAACWWATRLILENMNETGGLPNIVRASGENSHNTFGAWKAPSGFQGKGHSGSGQAKDERQGEAAL